MAAGHHYDDEGRITGGGVALADIADQFRTATYVLDENEVRQRCRAYRKHFPEAEIIYAGKALMIRAVAQWVRQEGLSVDVCSGGELAIALAAGVDPRRIVLHGNGKTHAELAAAVEAGVGRIVVDSLTEIVPLSARGHRWSGLIHSTSGNRAKSVSNEQIATPCSIASAAR